MLKISDSMARDYYRDQEDKTMLKQRTQYDVGIFQRDVFFTVIAGASTHRRAQ